MNLDKWERWDKLEKGTAYFILGQGEQKLDATIETAKILTARAISIMQISIGILLGLLGYASSTNDRGLPFQLSVLLILINFILLILCLRIYALSEIMPPGNLPSNLIDDSKVDDPEQELTFVESSINGLEKAIRFNQNQNAIRKNRLSIVIKCIWIGIGTVILYAFIFLWSSHRFHL